MKMVRLQAGKFLRVQYFSHFMARHGRPSFHSFLIWGGPKPSTSCDRARGPIHFKQVRRRMGPIEHTTRGGLQWLPKDSLDERPFGAGQYVWLVGRMNLPDCLASTEFMCQQARSGKSSSWQIYSMYAINMQLYFALICQKYVYLKESKNALSGVA